MQSVYYIIPTPGIGGTEKRFIELWCYLREQQKEFDFNLIISEPLYSAFKSNNSIYTLLKSHEHKITVFNIDINQPVMRFQTKVYKFVRAHTSKDDILHFLIFFPPYIVSLKHNKTVYSLAESSLNNVNIKARVLYLLSIFRARYIDILDPIVYKKITSFFFFKRKHIFLTPGSFTDTSVFKPADGFKKENWFVFLGRFSFMKQVVELFKAVPGICRKLEDAGHKGYKFIFLGYGQQEKELRDLLGSPAYQGLPIEIEMANAPEEILGKSKIFFSLQLGNNYPSKSLLEALAAGNIPLVTDVGTTRMIARPEFSWYVPEHFTMNDIAGQLISILSLSEDCLQIKMRAARSFVENNFTIKASAAYYTEFYRKLL